MSKIKDLLVFVAGLFSLLPGVPFLTETLVLPIEKQVFKGIFIAIIEIVSFCFFLMMWIYRAKIKQASVHVILRTAILSLFLFLVFTLCYLFFYDQCVYYPSGYDPLFMPLFKSASLNDFIQTHGGDVIKVIANHGRDTLVEEIQSRARLQLFFSIILFLINYILVFAPLFYTFFILTIRVQQDGQTEIPQAAKAAV